MKLRLTALAIALTAAAFAQGNNPLITLDEHGNGSLLFPGGTPIVTIGSLLGDPGPGGLPSALTYNLLGPPSLVAGDLFIQETVGATVVISDVIRFNPAGTGGNPAYPASVVFYSDNLDGVDAIADTGFPTLFYANTFSMLEVGPEGSNGVFYTPTDNQPGFVPGFNVTYHIISDDAGAAPEPATISMVGGAVIAVIVRRRMKK